MKLQQPFLKVSRNINVPRYFRSSKVITSLLARGARYSMFVTKGCPRDNLCHHASDFDIEFT